jgi:hypothetical protein
MTTTEATQASVEPVHVSEFDVIGTALKMAGDAALPEGTEFEHGDELYVVAKVTVKEISFPETKDGAIIRVHKARAKEAYVVDAEDAERVIAAERERQTGQGSIIAELNRVATDGDDEAF